MRRDREERGRGGRSDGNGPKGGRATIGGTVEREG